jgi:hypothetical protein
VVVPARVALDPGAGFDAVVNHELAHVLARDVTWVSALRGPLWLFVPVAVAASVPLFNRTEFSFAQAELLVLVVFLVGVLTLLAAALLRLREHEADRYAARAGSGPELLALLDRATGAAGPPPATRLGRLRALAGRPLARHPGPADRVRALDRPGGAYEGGWAQAAAVGFAAITAMGTVVTLAGAFGSRWFAWGGAAVANAAGTGVLALLIPSLFRRARRRADPQWWRPVTGVAVGVALGAFVSPAGSANGQIAYPLVWPGSFGRAVVGVAVVAAFAAGAVALAAGAAALAAGAARPRTVRLAQVAVAGVAFLAMWPAGPLAAFLSAPDELRSWLAYGMARNGWPVAAAVALLAYALPVAWARRPGIDTGRRSPWLVAGVATVVAGTVVAGTAVAGTAAILIEPAAAGLGAELRAQQQRWWVCVAAGVAVLAVIALATPRPYGWPRAVLAATGTTAAATAVHYGYARWAGRPGEPDSSAWDLVVAPVWLSVAVVLLAPLLVPMAGRLGARAPVPASPVTGSPVTGSPVTGSRAVASGGVASGRVASGRVASGRVASGRVASGRVAVITAVSVTAVLVSAAALAVVGVGVPGGTAMSARQAAIAAITARYDAMRHPLPAERAERVAKSAVLLVPPDWSPVDPGPVGEGLVAPTVPISEPSCEPLIRERFLAVGKPHLRSTGKSTYTSNSSDGDLKYTDLTVTVYSYGADVAERVLTAARDARRACSSFVLGDPPVSFDFVVRQATPPGIGELSWRYDSSMSAVVNGEPVTGRNAYAMVAVGYTVIVVHVLALREPLDEELLRRVLSNAEYVLLNNV